MLNVVVTDVTKELVVFTLFILSLCVTKMLMGGGLSSVFMSRATTNLAQTKYSKRKRTYGLHRVLDSGRILCHPYTL